MLSSLYVQWGCARVYVGVILCVCVCVFLEAIAPIRALLLHTCRPSVQSGTMSALVVFNDCGCCRHVSFSAPRRKVCC